MSSSSADGGGSSSSGGGAGAAAEGPRLQFSIRSRSGVQTFWAKPDVTKFDVVANEQGRLVEYSKDGSLLVVVNPDNVVVYNATNGAVRTTIARPHVSAISISPLNNFLVTFERCDPAVNNNERNLNVWRLDTAVPLIQFTQKNFISENWPTVKWSDDEAYYTRVVADEVLLFSPRAGKLEPARRIAIKGVVNAVFGPGAHPYKLATFAPERKSTPANIKIHQVPLPAAPVDVRVVANKSFFKATSAELLWNKSGTHLLVSTSTDVDQSGKSYYGETGLHFLSADGSFDCIVQLKKDGPIHNVAWSPIGKDFIVTYGFMPAQSTLFDLKCNPVLDFGEAPRNTIRWSPNGKYVCIGGFGNLQGQMDFWDIRKTEKIGTAQAHCAAVCEWAPDSCHFIAATVSPRIRVDNGYKIFRYDGGLFMESPVNELYQVVWRPARLGQFPDRPLSPLRVSATSSPITSKPATPAAAKYQHPNAAKYQHPHASAASSSSSLRGDETGVYKYNSPAPAEPPRRTFARKEDNLPPGWVEDEPASKPKKPRKPKQPKVAADGEGDGAATKTPPGFSAPSAEGDAAVGGGVGGESPSPAKAKKPKRNKQTDGAQQAAGDKGKQPADITQGVKNLSVSTPSPTQTPAPTPQSPPPSQEDLQRRAKAVSKKLIQIERLKKKQADGQPLTPEEQLKVSSEGALKKEMNSYSK